MRKEDALVLGKDRKVRPAPSFSSCGEKARYMIIDEHGTIPLTPFELEFDNRVRRLGFRGDQIRVVKDYCEFMASMSAKSRLDVLDDLHILLNMHSVEDVAKDLQKTVDLAYSCDSISSTAPKEKGEEVDQQKFKVGQHVISKLTGKVVQVVDGIPHNGMCFCGVIVKDDGCPTSVGVHSDGWTTTKFRSFTSGDLSVGDRFWLKGWNLFECVGHDLGMISIMAVNSKREGRISSDIQVILQRARGSKMSVDEIVSNGDFELNTPGFQPEWALMDLEDNQNSNKEGKGMKPAYETGQHIYCDENDSLWEVTDVPATANGEYMCRSLRTQAIFSEGSQAPSFEYSMKPLQLKHLPRACMFTFMPCVGEVVRPRFDGVIMFLGKEKCKGKDECFILVDKEDRIVRVPVSLVGDNHVHYDGALQYERLVDYEYRMEKENIKTVLYCLDDDVDDDDDIVEKNGSIHKCAWCGKEYVSDGLGESGTCYDCKKNTAEYDQKHHTNDSDKEKNKESQKWFEEHMRKEERKQPKLTPWPPKKEEFTYKHNPASGFKGLLENSFLIRKEVMDFISPDTAPNDVMWNAIKHRIVGVPDDFVLAGVHFDSGYVSWQFRGYSAEFGIEGKHHWVTLHPDGSLHVEGY